MGTIKKKIGLIVAVVLLLAFAGWAFFGTAGSDDYNYQGYVLDVREENKDTVITVINGDTQSEFVIKWYTRETYNGDKTAIEAGDHIKLNTTKNGNNIKKFSVYSGYTMEGKVVYVNEETAPFLLVTKENTNSMYFYKLIFAGDEMKPMETGCEIKVYYQYPLEPGNRTIVVDIVTQITTEPTPLTEQEINFITGYRYTIAETQKSA